MFNPYSDNNLTLRSRLFWCVAFFGPAAYFAYSGDYVAATLCGVAGIGGLSGHRMGALALLTSIVAAGVAIFYAPSLGMTHEFRFQQWFGTTGLTNRFLSVSVIGLAISLLVTVGMLYILGSVVRRRDSFDRMNRNLGFLLGVGQGVAMVVFFIGGMLILEPTEIERAAQREEANEPSNFASKLILNVAGAAHKSPLGPTLVEYNPLTRIPQLNKIDEVRKTATVLSDPARIEQLMRHPSIEVLKQRPSVKSAVEELNSDPQVQEVLGSGQPMGRQMLMTLMNHPAVLQLIDQPDFLDEVKKIIQSTKIVPAIAH